MRPGTKTSDAPPAQAATAGGPFTFGSPESQAVLVAATLRTHEEQGLTAQRHEAKAAQLDGEIGQESGEYERLRQEHEKRGEELKQLRAKIEAKQREFQKERDSAEAARVIEADAARAVVSMGAPLPSPAPRGQAYGPGTTGGRNPFPETGAYMKPDLCQTCGAPMVWSDQHNGYIHPLDGGGFELAGGSCRRRPQAQSGDTQVLNPGEVPAGEGR